MADLEPSRALLARHESLCEPPTEADLACDRNGLPAVRAAGFLPSRICRCAVTDEAALDRMLAGLIGGAQVQEVLLVAGDYAAPAGPYSMVADVLATGVLERHGLKRISMAGHPEGHPKVVLDEVRRAERERSCSQRGWPRGDPGHGSSSSTSRFCTGSASCAPKASACALVGVAGPARTATLLKFAMRCGVGPSIRALSVHPSTFMRLIGDHGPEHVVRGLAEARSTGPPISAASTCSASGDISARASGCTASQPATSPEQPWRVRRRRCPLRDSGSEIRSPAVETEAHRAAERR